MAKNRIVTKKALPLALQKMKILREYGNVVSCDIKRSTLTCHLDIRPSSSSDTYRVKICYQWEQQPSIWVLSPELKGYNGRSNIKHVYTHKPYPQICIYYPRYREWTPDLSLADTIIPWISTWLNTYEYWRITGVWEYPESPHASILT